MPPNNFASLSGYNPVPMYGQGQMGMSEIPPMFTGIQPPTVSPTDMGFGGAKGYGEMSMNTMPSINNMEGGGWGDFMKGMIGTTDNPGWGKMGFGALGALGTGYLGMKQYGLAQEQLAQHRQEFETNFAAQKGLTNANLQDRQTARVASNPGAYQSVGAYMAQNGIK
jgi:hypothetical protein